MLTVGETHEMAVDCLIYAEVQGSELAIRHEQALGRNALDFVGTLTQALINADEPSLRLQEQVDIDQESFDIKQFTAISMLSNSHHMHRSTQPPESYAMLPPD